MGTLLKVKGIKTNHVPIELELNEKEAIGYYFKYNAKDAKYGKGYQSEMILIVEGDIAKITENNHTKLEIIREWANTLYSSPEYYTNVTVLQVRDSETNTEENDIIRSIQFPNAYIIYYNEKINPLTGEGTFEIHFMQKRDKVTDIVLAPFQDEFCMKKPEIALPVGYMYSSANNPIRSFISNDGKDFEILEDTDKFCNLDLIRIKSTLTFKKEPNKPLIYCNYPEGVLNDYFGTNNYLLVNRVEVDGGSEPLLYAAYTNEENNKNYKLLVRVYNPNKNDKNLKVTIKQYGYSSSNSFSSAIPTWNQFCSDGWNRKEFVIPYDHTKDIIIEKFSGKFLELLACMEVNQKAIISVYILKGEGTELNTNYSDAKPVPLNKNPEKQVTYSGIADTWNLSTSMELKAGAILNNNKDEVEQGRFKNLSENIKKEIVNSFFYKIAKPNQKYIGERGKIYSETYCNFGENVPIHLVQNLDETTKAIATLDKKSPVANINNKIGHFSNVGNYGIEYDFTVNMHNNTTNTIKMKGYIISNMISHCAGIRTATDSAGKFLEPEGGKKNNRWCFFSCTLKPNESRTINFTYMHLSKGNIPCLMQWLVEDNANYHMDNVIENHR